MIDKNRNTDNSLMKSKDHEADSQMMQGTESKAVCRLMDAITDISDEIILDADTKVQANNSSRIEKSTAKKYSRIKSRITVGISFAAALIIILLTVKMLPEQKKRSHTSPGSSSTGSITASQRTENITEAGPTEAGPTEVIPTEAIPTEAGPTEVIPTETRPTEAIPTEAGTTESPAVDDALHVNINSKVVSYDTLSEMEADADLILRAERLDHEEPVLKYSDNNLYSFWTFSQVRISKIYKDDTEELGEGQTITILENEVFDSKTNTVFHVSGYRMMVAGNEYLLFLQKGNRENGETYFVSCGVNFGTVSLSEDGRDISPKYQNGSDMTDTKIFKEIWEDAKKKYQ